MLDVPDERPAFMPKPYGVKAVAGCELLWDGSDAILLVTSEGCGDGRA